MQTFLTNERLEALFKQFDIDETSYISRQNIKDSFSKLGKEVSDQELDDIMKNHDRTHDGVIHFEEFKYMML